MDFGQTEPSHYACHTRNVGESFLFNIIIKSSKFIITRHIHRLFHGSFCRFTAQAPEATPISETLHGERVIPVLFAIPRGQRQLSDGNITE